MAAEDERSLQRKPDLNLEQLKQGGLVVGSERLIQGSLMDMTGMALERITRERTGVPPGLQLPERPVYFLDPNSRRLVMISNRENFGKPERAGLFGEIVELDEEGKPHYLLSNSEIPLTTDSYQLVAIGPNQYKMPPSHIEVIDQDQAEKDTEEEGKRQQFSSWNTHIGDLNIWMNDLKINPNEDLATFLARYHSLKEASRREIREKIDSAFPDSIQGFSDKIVPVNLIFSDHNNEEMLVRASIDAGFYPAFWDMQEFVKRFQQLNDPESAPLLREASYRIHNWWPETHNRTLGQYLPAVITNDYNATWRLGEEGFRARTILDNILGHNPIFTFIDTWKKPEEEEEDKEPWKESNGWYGVQSNEQMYRGLLFKIKADLLLTMFLRGGAPIVK